MQVHVRFACNVNKGAKNGQIVVLRKGHDNLKRKRFWRFENFRLFGKVCYMQKLPRKKSNQKSNDKWVFSSNFVSKIIALPTKGYHENFGSWRSQKK